MSILRSPYARPDHVDRYDEGGCRSRASSPSSPARTSKTSALPCAWQAGGVENFVNTPRVLEIDRVTFTGAGVAAVVAESKYAAEDALGLIEVEYESLDVVVDVEEAAAEGAPPTTRERASNIVMDWSVGDAEGRTRRWQRPTSSSSSSSASAPDPEPDGG